MKLFSLIQLKYDQFMTSVRTYLSKSLGSVGTTFSNSSIFGQLINVLEGAVQNIMSYIEDAITENNKLTATRKRSVYNLAAITGYNPSLGTATSCVIGLSFKPNNMAITNIVIPNKTQLNCLQNGMTYNIILPQEAIVLDPSKDNSVKFLTLIEGRFETQRYISDGGELYTQNIAFNGDSDINYLEVKVNNEVWERVESLYDMEPDGKQYAAKTSLTTGYDLIFGNNQFGRALHNGDIIDVTYLIHSGEYGNLDPNTDIKFEFATNLHNSIGDDLDGNSIFNITIQNKENVNAGTFSEDVNQVKEMIGYNSRSLVLADPKNYKLFLNKFSFVGYNRTWSEPGSMIINSLILKNYKTHVRNGLDYFNLKEDDFKLSHVQKQSIINCINNSGRQIAGTVLNIFDPEIAKYSIYIYVKLKNTSYDNNYISNEIRKLLGEFFTNIKSDIFIPKSDITKLLKDNIDAIDGVTVYFLSAANEKALIDRKYVNKEYKYNPSLGTYDVQEETVYLYGTENPGLGLDSHGNIFLDNTDQFPVLMGGWRFISSEPGSDLQYTEVTDPVNIIFE